MVRNIINIWPLRVQNMLEQQGPQSIESGEQDMHVFIRRALMAATVSLLTACASSPNTFSNADPDVDFGKYETYGYFATLSTDTAQYQSLVSNFLKVAVAQELDKRGLAYDKEAPQLRVNFFINTKDKIKTRTVPTMGGGYYDYRDPFYDPWGGYGGYETRVDQYTEGTLNIDVVDTATNKLVWEGSVAGRLTEKDVRNMEKTIDEAVAAVMTGFPILSVGVQGN